MSLSYKYCLSLIGVGFIALNASLSANANELSNPQLPKPAIKTIKANEIGKSAAEVNGKRQREYVYKAPDNKVISNPQQLTRSQGYKVEVYGDADDLLAEVKDIEPKAFRKGETIQVGIFSQQKNAEIMVNKLAGAGFWARIVNQ